MITLNSSSPETYIRKHSFKFLVQFGVKFIRNNVFTIDKILIPKINLRVWISPPNCIRIVASLHQYGNCFFRDCNVPWIEFWAKDFTKSSILPIKILSKFAHSHLLKLQSNSSLVKPASYPFLLLFSSVICLVPLQPTQKTLLSVPETVDLLTFWFSPASSFSIFLGTITHFGKW